MIRNRVGWHGDCPRISFFFTMMFGILSRSFLIINQKLLQGMCCCPCICICDTWAFGLKCGKHVVLSQAHHLQLCQGRYEKLASLANAKHRWPAIHRLCKFRLLQRFQGWPRLISVTLLCRTHMNTCTFCASWESKVLHCQKRLNALIKMIVS